MTEKVYKNERTRERKNKSKKERMNERRGEERKSEKKVVKRAMISPYYVNENTLKKNTRCCYIQEG